MDTTTTEDEAIDITNDAEEGESEAETLSISKAEYDKMNQTLGSLKRELKDLKKSKDESKETSIPNAKAEESKLLEKIEKMSLRQAGVTHEDDIELARNTAKKWNVDIDEVLSDDDFKVKLERQQNNRANTEATSNVKGGRGAPQAKLTSEYWTAKGQPPTPADIPDRKARQKIITEMMKAPKNTKKFYND